MKFLFGKEMFRDLFSEHRSKHKGVGYFDTKLPYAAGTRFPLIREFKAVPDKKHTDYLYSVDND